MRKEQRCMYIFYFIVPDQRWAVDGRGRVTSDPRKAMREGAGLPLGGQEETGGYKGYGLALMVEVLCGVMSGIAMKWS